MKKVLAIALLSLAAVSSWAQGTVQFQNGQITFATAADRLVYLGTVGGTKMTGTNYAVGLYYMAGADQNIMSPTAGTQAGALAFGRPGTTTSPGVWANPGAAGNTRILDGVAITASATLQVRAWDITKYATFAQAFAANDYGWSQPFNQRMPDFAHGDPATLAYMEGLRAFAITVPEPSTIALGVLGVAGLLALRRRKQA
jgi:hypothetical protein